MKKYYLTKYLIFSDLPDSVILFNGFTGNMDLVSRGFAAKLRKTGLGGVVNHLSRADLEFMVKRGHVTTLQPEAERAAFRKLVEATDMQVCSAGPPSGTLLLLMSYDCNLACPYCYQKGIRVRKGSARMPEELLTSVLTKHYGTLFPGVAPSHLEVSLYGGEPFMRPNRGLIRLVSDFTARHGTRLSAVSNAIDLESVKEFLGPLPGMIASVQVTLDTPQKGKKLPRSYGGRFGLIIENIHAMLDKKVQVAIRMHVDGDNYEELNKIVDYLVEQEIVTHPRGYAYLAPIREHDDPAVKDQLMNLTGPAAREISRKLGHPLNMSAESMKATLSLREGRLKKTRFCMLGRRTSHVLDPFRDLYGCYEDAGHENLRTGSVGKDNVVFYPMRDVYLDRALHNIAECLDCPFALLCGGGCPYHGRRRRGSVMSPDCFDAKESLTEAIRYAYLENKKSRDIRYGA